MHTLRRPFYCTNLFVIGSAFTIKKKNKKSKALPITVCRLALLPHKGLIETLNQKFNMTQEKTFLVGINRNSFRAGEPAEVIGLKMCQPSEMAEPRLCYEIEFGDGIIDYVPLSDNLNFDIISWTKLANGNVPPVRN